MSVLYFTNNNYPNAKVEPAFTNEIPFQHQRGVAYENGGVYFASGLNEGGGVHFVRIPGTGFTSLLDWVTKSFGDPAPVTSANLPGTIYKRIWRPTATSYLSTLNGYITQLNSSLISLKILINKLEDLFETIEPTVVNINAYGHKIRELLLLACMEVESSWTAVLKENGYPTRNYNTNDYVKLLGPLMLDAYDLSLNSYPAWPQFNPFSGWNSANPTVSLPWYHAYNQTKHDREQHLNLATLQHTIFAIGAATIMFRAQFGFNMGTGNTKGQIINNLFKVVTTKFQLYEDSFYLPQYALPAGTSTPELIPWSAPVNYIF